MRLVWHPSRQRVAMVQRWPPRGLLLRVDATVLAALLLTCATPAQAVPDADEDADAGARSFPTTLTLDDPGVENAILFPFVLHPRTSADGGETMKELDVGAELEKTITAKTEIILEDGVVFEGGEHGWENLTVGGKWQVLTNAPHEAVVSIGVAREFGGSGTSHIGADRFGSTAATIYGGKGFGDLASAVLQPLAVTGEFSETIADQELKRAAAAESAGARFNRGSSNLWSAGLSIQYSLTYWTRESRDHRLPGFLGDLIPLVEFTWTSPQSSPSEQGTTWIAAPGVIYARRWGEIGLEALVPLNRAAGSTIGLVGLVQFSLD